MSFRHGQWVKFDPVHDLLYADGPKLSDLAHLCADGSMLGVYQRDRLDPVIQGDGSQLSIPEHVKPVSKKGGDIRVLIEDTAQVITAQLDPAKLTSLRAMTDRNDVPAVRLATMDAGWHPKEFHEHNGGKLPQQVVAQPA